MARQESDFIKKFISQYKISFCSLLTLIVCACPLASTSAETIYINIEKGDTLSILLHSTGITPLYGPGQSVEKYRNLFPEIYTRALEVGEYAPIESEDVRFKENLTHTVAKQYSIKQRLRTTAELEQYLKKLDAPIKQAKTAATNAPLPTQVKPEINRPEEGIEANWSRHLLVKIYLTQIEREFTNSNLVTKTTSDLQAGLGLELGLNHWFVQLDYWPWLGESEGLSFDYRAGVVRKNICDSIFICELGLAHRRLSFISRNLAGDRRPDYLTSLLPHLKLGARIFKSLSMSATFEPLVLAEFDQATQDVDGVIYGLGLGWKYRSHLQQSIELESLSAEGDNGDKLESTRLFTSLTYTF